MAMIAITMIPTITPSMIQEAVDEPRRLVARPVAIISVAKKVKKKL